MMYIHPDDYLVLFHARSDELQRAAAQEGLARGVVRARRAAQRTRWHARFVDRLSRAALRPRQA